MEHSTAPSPLDAAKQETGRFTRDHTALCKGVACVLLLYHHLFYLEVTLAQCVTVLDRLAGGTFGLQFVNYTAHVGKVCVAMFLILSGYGLTESWRRRAIAPDALAAPNRALVRFSWDRLLRLMARYWLIFLLFVPFGALFGRDPAVLFLSSTTFRMVAKILINFSGMSNLFFGTNQYTFNATWWFMSVIILCYLGFPLLRRLADKSPLLLLPVALLCAIGMFVPYAKNVAFWIIPFLLGMLLSDYGVLDRMAQIVSARPAWQGIAASSLLVVCFALLRGRHRYGFDLPLALAVILFCVAVLARLDGVAALLRFIGKHSANIFLFHSFLCAYYFAYIIYSPRYPLLILLFLLMLCLLISICLERFIRWLGTLTGRAGRGEAPGEAGQL